MHESRVKEELLALSSHSRRRLSLEEVEPLVLRKLAIIDIRYTTRDRKRLPRNRISTNIPENHQPADTSIRPDHSVLDTVVSSTRDGSLECVPDIIPILRVNEADK